MYNYTIEKVKVIKKNAEILLEYCQQNSEIKKPLIEGGLKNILAMADSPLDKTFAVCI